MVHLKSEGEKNIEGLVQVLCQCGLLHDSNIKIEHGFIHVW